jgi:hypothetical protein
MRLSAEAAGPWPLETAWERAPDGATVLTYSASKAGAARGAARSRRGQAFWARHLDSCARVRAAAMAARPENVLN